MNKKILNEIDKEWLKSSTRRMSYQKIRLYHHGLYDGYKRVFGFSQHYYLNRVKRGIATSFIRRDETEKQFIFLEKKLANAKFIRNGLGRLAIGIEKYFRECVDKASRFSQHYKSANNKSLLIALNKYYGIEHGVSPYFWILFDDFEHLLATTLERLMEEKGIDKKEIQRLLLVLSQPWIITPLDMERLSLLRVALLDGKKQEMALLDHHGKFSFLPMYDIDYDAYPLEYFRKELQKIRSKFSKFDIQKEIKDIQKKYADRKKQSEDIIKIFKAEPKIAEIMKFYMTFAAYKDRKPYVRDQIGYYVRNLFLEIAERLSLTLTQVLFLTELELIEALKGKRIFLGKEIDARIKDSAYFLKDGKATIITSKVDLKIIDGILDRKKGKKELTGISASPGKIRGAVSIIISNADFPKFKAGHILVASGTRPDYIPLMKKAAAIVTDEGGLLSHAAIVSRELNKPCIVGTKIATKVLRDGDVVEVDANKGVVRIIKKR